MGLRAAALLLLLAHQTSLAAAQADAPLTLSVTQGGKEIGRESFTLSKGRGRGAAGTTLSATARYPATAPTTRLTAVLERTPAFAIAKFQLDVDSPSGTTVILAAGSGARLIVRTVATGSESGRELPGGPDVVLLDDEVHSLYSAVADLATPAGKRLTAIFPRTGKRASFTARLETTGQGEGLHIALTGDLAGTLVTDTEGRLQRLDLPAQNKIVSRAE
ncbi:MAG: hypothetical protein H0T50_05480 [Gemmatimonadales bacterium]|nr:hypothetical protein [Gemmatimonadales bacterium]